MTTAITTPNSSRRTLLLLAALFILPFVVGSGLFWLDWRPGKFGNHGELLQPPRTLPAVGLYHADGRPLPTSELLGKWLLVLPVKGSCTTTCQNNLQGMLQVHVALNKEQKRMQRVLIVGDVSDSATDDPPMVELQRLFPGLLVAAVQANVAGEAWDGALSDIERLLKYSWIR
jgi:cytochrome oxidase Cu insertion factor (SCO1/SenC/PrrC family)